MYYLTLNDVLELHRQVIAQSGGAIGILTMDALESVLAQPRMTFGGEDLYLTLVEKAAVLGYALIRNYPFLDGNKRIGFAAAVLFLEINGHCFQATEADATIRTLALAAGAIREAEYAAWLKANSRPA